MLERVLHKGDEHQRSKHDRIGAFFGHIKDEETTYDVTLDLPERHPEDFDGAKDQAITDKSYD